MTLSELNFGHFPPPFSHKHSLAGCVSLISKIVQQSK